MSKQIFVAVDLIEFKELIRESVKETIHELTQDNEERAVYASRKEAADILGISLPTLNKYTKTGKVQGYRIGGKVLYKVDELQGCLKEISTRQ